MLLAEEARIGGAEHQGRSLHQLLLVKLLRARIFAVAKVSIGYILSSLMDACGITSKVFQLSDLAENRVLGHLFCS